MKKIKLKVGDPVIVIKGRGKKTKDFISKIDYEKEVVYLKEVNQEKYDNSTHEKKKKKELKKVMIPVHISNVSYYYEKSEKKEKKTLITKIGYQIKEDGKKVRIARKLKKIGEKNILID